jgi:hypothetical protein
MIMRKSQYHSDLLRKLSDFFLSLLNLYIQEHPMICAANQRISDSYFFSIGLQNSPQICSMVPLACFRNLDLGVK